MSAEQHITLGASVAVYDHVNARTTNEPFGSGGSAILDDGTILILVQIEAEPAGPGINWIYEVYHYTADLTLLGMVSTGNLPMNAFYCYFYPRGGQGAVLLVAGGEVAAYWSAVVDGSAATPTIGAFVARSVPPQGGDGRYHFGHPASRCQWIDAWQNAVVTDGYSTIWVFDRDGANVATLTLADNSFLDGYNWMLRGSTLFLTTYSRDYDNFMFDEWKVTKTGDTFTLDHGTSFAPYPTDVPRFYVYNIDVNGTSEDPDRDVWYGEYVPINPGSYSAYFRYFKVADDVNTNTVYNQIDEWPNGSYIPALYPAGNFYSALNQRPGLSFRAGQLGGRYFYNNGYDIGAFPEWAIHIIGLDITDHSQYFLPLKNPGAYGEQDTLQAGSVTFTNRNGQWVVTCTTVNLGSPEDFFGFYVWTGTIDDTVGGKLKVWTGEGWYPVGNPAVTSGPILKTSDGIQWLREHRSSDTAPASGALRVQGDGGWVSVPVLP